MLTKFVEILAITTCVLTLALSTPFVALRLYVRQFLTRQICVWFVFYWNLLYALALVIFMIATGCVGGVGKAHSYLAETKCQDPYIVVVSASVISVVSDLMILVIPIAAIWGLHMAREKKIKLGTVFAIGSLGVLFSVARLVFGAILTQGGLNQYSLLLVSSLNLAEHAIGLIVSSMPSLPAFIEHLRRGGAHSASVSFEPSSQRHQMKKKESQIAVLAGHVRDSMMTGPYSTVPTAGIGTPEVKR